jgi:hypothetical protein
MYYFLHSVAIFWLCYNICGETYVNIKPDV